MGGCTEARSGKLPSLQMSVTLCHKCQRRPSVTLRRVKWSPSTLLHRESVVYESRIYFHVHKSLPVTNSHARNSVAWHGCPNLVFTSSAKSRLRACRSRLMTPSVDIPPEDTFYIYKAYAQIFLGARGL